MMMADDEECYEACSAPPFNNPQKLDVHVLGYQIHGVGP